MNSQIYRPQMALVTSQRIAKNPFNVKTSDILSSYQEIPGNLNIIDTLINVDDKKILIKPGKRLILKNIGN